MIPSDLASRLQLSTDAALRPVTAAQEISDRLSDLIPGQRLVAQVQAQLPNGTYRAIINQRDITLALPFSAKPGDSLELEVVDSNGKLALAVAARPDASAGQTGRESVSASLSRTGQLISDLFAGAHSRNRETGGLTLNGNQPIANAPPASAGDLLPLLKQAIVQSGMFYESHQAGWVEGRYPGAALLREPQGKLSAALQNAAPSAGGQAGGGHFAAPAVAQEASGASVGGSAAPTTTLPSPHPPALPENKIAAPGAASDNPNAPAGINRPPAAAPPPGNAAPSLIAPETVAVVQQQLESLATQQFAWQGQIWPGQEMRWEIEEDGRQRAPEEGSAGAWQTRLHLTLPALGELDARIRLDGNRIQLDLDTGDSTTQSVLRGAIVALQRQFSDAGLTLGGVGIGSLAARAEA